jgi:beta-lactamase class A
MPVSAPPTGILPAMGNLLRGELTGSPAEPTVPLTELTGSLAELLAAAPGCLSAAVADGSGVLAEVEGDRVVTAASTVKVPIMVAVLRRVARGQLRLGDMVRLEGPRVGGSGPLAALTSVTRLPVGELVELMITLSDNDATNALLDLVGLAEVDLLCAELGMTRTRVRRRLMDQDAVARGRDNTTCAADLAQVLALLRRGDLLDAPQTRFALDVLAAQQFVDGLPALVPTGVWRGNKTGELFGVRHDMMLLEVGGRWAAVAVTATDLADATTGVDRGMLVLPTFGRIGELVAGSLVAGA